MNMLFAQTVADSFTLTNVTWAAIFALAGGLLYAAWQKGLRAWLVTKTDTLQDLVIEKIKPYVGDDAVAIRKAMEDVEGVILGMVDIVLARRFGADVVKKVDKNVLIKALEIAAANEQAAGHVTGIELYTALKAKLDAMPGFLDPKDALALLAAIEAHEQEEKDAAGIAAVVEAKKAL